MTKTPRLFNSAAMCRSFAILLSLFVFICPALGALPTPVQHGPVQIQLIDGTNVTWYPFWKFATNHSHYRDGVRYTLLGTNDTAPFTMTNVTMSGGELLVHDYGYFGPFGANLVSNTVLSDITFTSTETGNAGGNLLVLNDGTGTANARGGFTVKLNNVSATSPNNAVAIYAGPEVHLNSCYFKGGISGLETRGTMGTFMASVFEMMGGDSIGNGVAYLCNDDGTNKFEGCHFIAHEATNYNQCVIQWVRSGTTYDHCTFSVARNSASGTSGAPGEPDCAILLSESPSWSTYNHCTFELSYTNAPKMAQLIGFHDHTPGNFQVELNGCFYYPETNGIVVNNTGFVDCTATFLVRGGNLKPYNFSDPTTVTFLPPASIHYKSVLENDDNNSTATLKTSSLSVDVVAGRKYLITGKIALSENVAADGAKIDLYGAGAYGFTYYNVQGTFQSTALNSTTRMGAPDSVISASTFTGTGMLEISGTAYFSQAHPLTLRFAQNAHSTGTLTLLKGSYLQLTDITD